MNPALIPKDVYIEKSVADFPIVRNIRKNHANSNIHIVDKIYPGIADDRTPAIEVIDFKGRFLKPCPGTKNYICCGYRILHFGEQCSVGCTYCILQAYFSSNRLRLFANWDQMLEETEHVLKENSRTFFRIGTGEFTDSLLLDPITEFSKIVVPFFAHFPNCVLELKTKTDHVDHLEGLKHAGRTIVAWSMNSRRIISSEEGRAVSLERRLECARLCVNWGYRLAFHFDPMIYYEGWEEGYREVIELIFDKLDPEKIVWISLGCFRFMPALKNIIEEKYPESNIIYGEFILGIDGKMRYFKDIRIMMYKKMVKWITDFAPGVCVYLCMESREIWEKAFGFTPDRRGGLPKMLDKAAQFKCGD